MMGPIQPPDHHGLGDLEAWETEGLKTAYKRLLRWLRRDELDADELEQATLKVEVENELADRGVDPRTIAREAGRG